MLTGVTGMWQLVQHQEDHHETRAVRYLFRR